MLTRTTGGEAASWRVKTDCQKQQFSIVLSLQQAPCPNGMPPDGAQYAPQPPSITIVSQKSLDRSVDCKADWYLQEDLKCFHARHYPHVAVPNVIVDAGESSLGDGHASTPVEYDGEDDDGLGYYPDGVKRTLTDEQVAMFRHSEIQALLRERRRREEQAGDTSEEGEVREDETRGAEGEERDEVISRTTKRHPEADLITTDFGAQTKRKKKRKKRGPKAHNEDASAPAGNTTSAKNERRHPGAAALQHADAPGDDDYTPRRIARELDEVDPVSIEVDYG